MHTLLLSTISKNNKRRQYKFLFTSSSKFFFYLDSRVMRKTISRLPGKKTGIHVMSPTIGLTTSIYSLITQATTHSPSSLTSYFKTTIHTFIANHYSRDTTYIVNTTNNRKFVSVCDRESSSSFSFCLTVKVSVFFFFSSS